MKSKIPDENPTDPRLFVPNIEFYITNVCNLTCSNCNRFNNFDFKGWQKWSDYESIYSEWATKIRLQRITILGGEPLLNPSVLDWVDGINRLWDKPVQLLTNGTQLNRVPGLYERFNTFRDSKHNASNWLGISLHNANDRQRCFDEIYRYLKGSVIYVARDDPKNADNAFTAGGDHAFVDSNGVIVRVWEYNSFYTAAIKQDALGQLTLHNSNPQKAYEICGFVQYDCYHFVRGKLYRCGPVALFPEFDQQHSLAISDEDRLLINSYAPLTVDVVDQHGHDWFMNQNVLAQCKFCPDNTKAHILKAVSKKTGATSSYD